MSRLLCVATLVSLACFPGPGLVMADLIGTADENGNAMSMRTGTGVTNHFTGTSGTDPFDKGNGLKPMIYDVDSLSTQVAGDVLLTGSGAVGVDDLLRFTNDPTTGHGLLVVYSDIEPGDHDLADVGIPASRQTNSLSFVEMLDPAGSGDSGLFNYIPTSGQPGFQPDENLHINFISDAVPEPASIVLLAAGLGPILVFRRRRRARTAR